MDEPNTLWVQPFRARSPRYFFVAINYYKKTLWLRQTLTVWRRLFLKNRKSSFSLQNISTKSKEVSMENYTLIYNTHLIDANTNIFGSLLIKNNKIHQIIPHEKKDLTDILSLIENKATLDAKKIDGKELTLMPAFVDMHVHFRYPGQSAKEDLESGSRAACHGGMGTVVLMPNTNPVVSTPELAAQIREQTQNLGLTDALQTLSITKDFSGTDISHLDCLENQPTLEIGCKAIPVITEDGKDVLSDDIMKAAMEKCSKAGVIVSCHCEDPKLVSLAKKLRDEKNFFEAEKVLAEAENTFTERNLKLALETNCKVHIAHISTKKALDSVRAAKAASKGKNLVTCEATPHHLGLNQEMPGFENQLVNPPLRPQSDMEAVIEAILDGTVDVIGTDHAPHTFQDKESGACGFSGIETAFSVCYSVLVKERGLTLEKLSDLMSNKPSKILGINKGLLKEGYIADLVLLDLEKEYTVDSNNFYSKGKFTPINGKKYFGTILKTFHHGNMVYPF